MPYTAYSTDDFLADESFQSFVIDHDPAATQFWRAWAAEHPGKQAEFDEAVALLQLLATGQLQTLPQSLKQAETAKLWQAMHAVPEPKAQPALRVGQRARRWAGAALGALALGFAGVGLWQRATSPPTLAWTSYATKAGERRKLTLPDGSRVTLNANSVLKLATTWQPGHAREVWLTGEAFFRVQHTALVQLTAVATAPANVKFTVHAGPLDVAVLGTQFDVLNRPGRTKVVLQSGQVQLRHVRAGRPETLLLKPGELAEFRPAATAAPLAKRPVDAALYAAWTSGNLDFADTPAAAVFALLEDTYGLHITLRNPALRQQKLSGSVPSQDLDVLLATLAKSLDTNVHRTGNHVRFD
ncbi:FecR family protein [Hymenobacter setariae]|nr:FecR domain-containing protein [Hymenobacter setariae]